ncbi:hypothetical protein SCALM49S_09168 [Streptomyces californicus]
MRARPEGVRVESCALGRPGRGGPPGRCACDGCPPLPRESWAPTKETLHRFLQIVGKVRLAAGVRRNHWWNVPFHLTGDGITTRPSGPLGDGTVFTVDFDFTTHRLRTLTLDGRQVSFPLTGLSVGDFYREFTGALQNTWASMSFRSTRTPSTCPTPPGRSPRTTNTPRTTRPP